MEDDKFKDLLEDEELKLLRLAALATKSKKEQLAVEASKSLPSLPINSIVTSSAGASESLLNQIPFVQSDRNANNYSWRKSNQPLRRRGGSFPKNNSRSNLIVINPVSLNDDKRLEEKTPALILPQHRWCNSGNEDSMSPKTLRRTGPTRFNRHGSDSESSESDYENEDSGSNETVLQDEPAEHFSCLSPDSDVVAEGGEKKRRLSFQNLDPEMQSETYEKSETTSIYNLLKNPSYDYPDNKSDNYTPMQNQNDDRHTWNHSVENDYSSYKHFNRENVYVSNPLDTSDKFVGKQINSLVINNGASGVEADNFKVQSSDNWQQGEGLKIRESTYSTIDSGCYKDDGAKTQFLAQDDLRFALKKRMQSTSIESNNEKAENERYSPSNMWDRKRLKTSYKENVNEDSYISLKKNDEQCFSEAKEEHNSTLSYKHHRRSSSRERSKQEGHRDRSRIGYSSGPESIRYDHARSRSQERSRSRSKQSSSWDTWRNEHNSTQERFRRDLSSSPNRYKHGHTFAEEGNGHSPSKSKNYENSFSQGRSKNECSSSPEKSRRKWSSSRYRSRRGHSSSSESRHGRSASRDSELGSSRSRNRNRRGRSSSQERRRYNHSPSQERSKHGRKSNRDKSRSRHRSSESQDSRKRHHNSSQEESHSSDQERSQYKLTSSARRTYNERSPNKHRSRQDITSSEDKDGHCAPGQEILKDSNEENGKSQNYQKVGENSKLLRESSKLSVEKRLHSSIEERKANERKTSPVKVNLIFKNRYSRSRSNSTSSSSSSSSYSSRPKIRSVSSVVKSVPTMHAHTQGKETHGETKSFVRNTIVNMESDSCTSNKKNISVADYNKLSVSDASKRVPVHMRLGAFPRKRVIQMPKDVEAAFVNTSSGSESESVNAKCKRENIRIVTDVYDTKSVIEIEKKYSETEKSAKRSPDLMQEKSKRLKIKR